jgi:hypothetical protein
MTNRASAASKFACVLLFSSHPPQRRKARRPWWSFVLRKPHWWLRNTLYPWLIRTLGRGDPTHVALSDGFAVLEITSWGDAWFPYRHYVVRHPALLTYIVVPMPRPLAFRGHVKVGHKGPWRTLAAWLTRGRVASNDCVAVAKRYLAWSGVEVPRHVTTPQALWDWGRSQGYDIGEFDSRTRVERDPAGDA